MRAIHRSIPAAAVLSVALAAAVSAAEKHGRLSGSVVNLSTDRSEIMVRAGTAGRVVEYTSGTTFKAGSASNSKTATPASASDVAVGNYLTCVGSWDGVKLAAKNCMIRPSKRP